MRTICPACECAVDKYGDGDGTLTLAGQVYHAPCLDLTELDDEELHELNTNEAQNELQNRAERAHERWLSSYYGGSTPTFAEDYERSQAEARKLK